MGYSFSQSICYKKTSHSILYIKREVNHLTLISLDKGYLCVFGSRARIRPYRYFRAIVILCSRSINRQFLIAVVANSAKLGVHWFCKMIKRPCSKLLIIHYLKLILNSL